MVSPSDMILFAAVARAGSFTGAAAQLGLSKQSVSERVARLEAALGVRLLERTTRRIRLTEAGATYVERCAVIAAQIDDANDEARSRQREPVGTLRVTAPVLYGRRFLGPVIATYLRQFPRVRVEVMLADRTVDLVHEGFDLAIRVGDLGDSSLTARKLGEGHVHFVASPDFIARAGAITRTSLRDLPWVGLRATESWTIEGVTIKRAPALVVNDLEAVCDAAVAGVGIAKLPAIVCADHVRARRLRVLFGAAPAMVRGLYAVYPSRAYLPATVRRFIELITEVAEPMQPLGDRDAGGGGATRAPARRRSSGRASPRR